MVRGWLGWGLVALILGGCTEEIPDPGRVTLHRLNRAEYNNTVVDLMGTRLRPADDFPNDDHGYGYDNIADVLAISPLQIELYYRAAALLVAELLNLPPSMTFQAEEFEGRAGSRYRDGGWSLWGEGTLEVPISIPEAGRYRLVVNAFGGVVAGEVPRLRVGLDGEEVGGFSVSGAAHSRRFYRVEFLAEAGDHVVGFALGNPHIGKSRSEIRKVVLDWIRVEGPFGRGEVPSARSKVIPCALEEEEYQVCAASVVEEFGSRAFRRPLIGEERSRYLGLVELGVEEGDGPERGLSLAMQAILLSPHFIFRVELDEDPAGRTAHRLTDYELATRLSYFLWSTMPDAELFSLAGEGRLQEEGVLTEQVERLLADPRAVALTENFAGQWLFSRAVLSAEPEPNMFPDFDDELASAMKRESDLFFGYFLESNLPVSTLLEPGFTFLNERLAEHYGIPGVVGEAFSKVPVEGTMRGGLLTQGAMHTVTSHQTRTSLVLRGKWVLSQLLCDEPPPPPPGVEALESQGELTGSLRDRLARHRSSAMCASCHQVMDPIGFALENFNAISQWRTEDEGYPIDARGDFPDGTRFEGPKELARAVVAQAEYPECITEHLMIYGLGRGPQKSDLRWRSEIVEKGMEAGGGLGDLIREIVLSEAFRSRRGEAEEAGEAP